MSKLVNTYTFAVNHAEATTLIANNGMDVTYVLEGEPGVGKSTVLSSMKNLLGDAYDYIYVDVPLKDIPDIALSMPDHETQTTKAYINSLWLGTDPKKPKVIMLDEMFKGSEYVKLMMNRLALERTVGDYVLPEGSIVFGTTNFQTDGVGDRTNGHTNSRVTRVAMRKPTKDEWLAWASNNNIHEYVMTWVAQNEHLMASYKDTEFNTELHKTGEGNFHYIYHPQHNAQYYVCPRTLEKASHQLHNIDKVGEALTTKGLIGTLGAKAALDLSAMIALGADLPHPQEIVANPETAKVPKNPVAKLILIYKSLNYINEDTLDKYATYFKRFESTEMYAVWIRTAMTSTNVQQHFVRNKQLVTWARDNHIVL